MNRCCALDHQDMNPAKRCLARLGHGLGRKAFIGYPPEARVEAERLWLSYPGRVAVLVITQIKRLPSRPAQASAWKCVMVQVPVGLLN